MPQYTIDFIAQHKDEEQKGYFSSHKRYSAKSIADAEINLLPEIKKCFDEATTKGYFVSTFFIVGDNPSKDGEKEVFIDGLVELPVIGEIKYPLQKKKIGQLIT